MIGSGERPPLSIDRIRTARAPRAHRVARLAAAKDLVSCPVGAIRIGAEPEDARRGRISHPIELSSQGLFADGALNWLQPLSVNRHGHLCGLRPSRAFLSGARPGRELADRLLQVQHVPTLKTFYVLAVDIPIDLHVAMTLGTGLELDHHRNLRAARFVFPAALILAHARLVPSPEWGPARRRT